MKRLVCLLVALLALGCADRPDCGAYAVDGETYDGNMCEERLTRELRVSSAFSPDLQEAIVRASDDWAEWTHWRAALTITVVDKGADVYPADLPGGAIADQNARTGEIRLQPETPAWQARAAIAHELGHSFGLGHARPRDQAMHPNSNAPISADDIAVFDRLWVDRQ
jgi:hypothetical protein